MPGTIAFTYLVLFLIHREREWYGWLALQTGSAQLYLFFIAGGSEFMTVDLTDGWNYWAVIEAPVDALRRRYGIAPAGDTGRAANARSAQSIAF